MTKVYGGKYSLSSFFFFSSRRRHTRCSRDWSSDVCSSDLGTQLTLRTFHTGGIAGAQGDITQGLPRVEELFEDRKSTRLNSSHGYISYAVFCLKKKKKTAVSSRYEE